MVRVFISYYSKADAENALTLKALLEAANQIDIKAIIASREEGPIELIPEKIARELDTAAYFIPFYTSAGKDSFWVNQETGYAFSQSRLRGLRIIPIWADRNFLRGFITPGTHHISASFELKGNPAETFDNILKYLVDMHQSPIRIKMDEHPAFASNDYGTDIILNMSIHLENSGSVSDSHLYFILPAKEGVILELGHEEYLTIGKKEWMYDEGERLVYPRVNVRRASNIPTAFADKFEFAGEGLSVNRFELPLETLYGPNTYESPVYFDLRSTTIPEFDFGVYLTAPNHDPIFYQGTIVPSSKTLSWMDKCAKPARIRIRL